MPALWQRDYGPQILLETSTMHQKDYRSENELLQNNHQCGNGNEIVSGTRMQNVSERLPCPAVGRRGILRRRLGQKTTAVAVKK